MSANAGFNPVERQKRIKLDQLNLNVDKALAQLRSVKQQVAEANVELQQAHGELAAMQASTLQAVQEVRRQQGWHGGSETLCCVEGHLRAAFSRLTLLRQHCWPCCWDRIGGSILHTQTAAGAGAMPADPQFQAEAACQCWHIRNLQ
jgi:hypothetical protein